MVCHVFVNKNPSGESKKFAVKHIPIKNVFQMPNEAENTDPSSITSASKSYHFKHLPGLLHKDRTLTKGSLQIGPNTLLQSVKSHR